jgi:glycosyltransferase involved in cell wall biosynthesis
MRTASFLPGPSYSDPSVREYAGWVGILDQMRDALIDMGYAVFVPDIAEAHLRDPHRVLGYSMFAAAQVVQHGPFDLLVGAPGYSYGAMLAQPQACKVVYVWNNSDPYRRRQLEPEWRTTPFVPTEHREVLAARVVDPTYEELNRQALLLADHVVACSPWVKKTHSEVVPADHISIAFWGVDSEIFTPPAHRNAPPFLRVLFVGSDVVRKGLIYLLQAADLARVKLTIVGAPLEIPNVHCLGMVPYREMSKVMEQQDVICIPTVEDGIACVIQEAMACGVVPIATPEAAEVFEDGVSGFTVPYRDSVAIREKVQYLIDNPARLHEMASAAIRLAQSQTWSQFRSDFSEIVQRQVRRKQFLNAHLPLPFGGDVGVFESAMPWLKAKEE